MAIIIPAPGNNVIDRRFNLRTNNTHRINCGFFIAPTSAAERRPVQRV